MSNLPHLVSDSVADSPDSINERFRLVTHSFIKDNILNLVESFLPHLPRLREYLAHSLLPKCVDYWFRLLQLVAGDRLIFVFLLFHLVLVLLRRRISVPFLVMSRDDLVIHVHRLFRLLHRFRYLLLLH